MSYNGPPPGPGYEDRSSDKPDAFGCAFMLAAVAVLAFMFWGASRYEQRPERLRAGDLAIDKFNGQTVMTTDEPDGVINETKYAVRYDDGRVRWLERAELIKILPPSDSPRTTGERSTTPYGGPSGWDLGKRADRPSGR